MVAAATLKFEQGKTYQTERGTTSVTVVSIIGGRLITKADGGYYMLHTLEGKYVGHWWNDGERQSALATKPFYPSSLQADSSLDYYNIVLPKPEPVVTIRRLIDTAGSNVPFWGSLGPIKHFPKSSIVWNDTLLVEVSVDGVVTEKPSLKDFKASKYWELMN